MIRGLYPEVAPRLSVPVRYRGGGSGAGNNTVTFGTTKLADFSIGELSYKNVVASVFDLSEIRTKLRFPHLDGSIGYPVFEQFVTFVNVDRSTISFSNRVFRACKCEHESVCRLAEPSRSSP